MVTTDEMNLAALSIVIVVRKIREVLGRGEPKCHVEVKSEDRLSELHRDF